MNQNKPPEPTPGKKTAIRNSRRDIAVETLTTLADALLGVALATVVTGLIEGTSDLWPRTVVPVGVILSIMILTAVLALALRRSQPLSQR